MKNVLIETAVEKRAIAADGAANSKPKLVLTVGRFHIRERVLGIKQAIAQIIKGAAMQVVSAGLGDNINHRAAGTS